MGWHAYVWVLRAHITCRGVAAHVPVSMCSVIVCVRVPLCVRVRACVCARVVRRLCVCEAFARASSGHHDGQLQRTTAIAAVQSRLRPSPSASCRARRAR
jgi:hypothetical protein